VDQRTAPPGHHARNAVSRATTGGSASPSAKACSYPSGTGSADAPVSRPDSPPRRARPRSSGDPPLRHAPAGERADQRLLEIPHVLPDVVAATRELQDG